MQVVIALNTVVLFKYIYYNGKIIDGSAASCWFERGHQTTGGE
jgi:predicted heme/steroid binding protein